MGIQTDGARRAAAYGEEPHRGKKAGADEPQHAHDDAAATEAVGHSQDPGADDASHGVCARLSSMVVATSAIKHLDTRYTSCHMWCNMKAPLVCRAPLDKHHARRDLCFARRLWPQLGRPSCPIEPCQSPLQLRACSRALPSTTLGQEHPEPIVAVASRASTTIATHAKLNQPICS